jgi:hypothetical protein
MASICKEPAEAYFMVLSGILLSETKEYNPWIQTVNKAARFHIGYVPDTSLHAYPYVNLLAIQQLIHAVIKRTNKLTTADKTTDCMFGESVFDSHRGQIFLSSLPCRNRHWGLLCNMYCRLLPRGVKRPECEADVSPPPSVVVQNAPPPPTFTPFCLITVTSRVTSMICSCKRQEDFHHTKLKN